MIKTSVIIPVYNTKEYLEECIESVLAQTQKEIEIIIIDDGSDDGSLDIIDDYVRRYPFIRKIEQNHLFQGTARNRGLEAASGKYVYFMDSDDAIKPDLFSRCYALCKSEDLDYVTFDAHGFVYDENDTELTIPDDIFDRTVLGIEDRIYTGPEFWTDFYNRHGILYLCWLHYIKRDFLLENDLFFEERTYFEDNDWILRLYMNAQSIRYIPEELHLHRWRRNSNMLSGFTVDLLRGCFRMHDVLLKLYRGSTDEKRIMISDVLRLNICRFDRLREVNPALGYREEIERFCKHLNDLMSDEQADNSAYYVSFAAFERILHGTGNWDRDEAIETIEETARASFRKRHGFLFQNKRIAIYGTGRVSAALTLLISRHAPDMTGELFFIHTNEPTGSEFLGYRVWNVKDIVEADPDIIIIGSIYYRDSILKQLKIHLPEGSRSVIADIPREIKFLQDNYEDFKR